jgi:hypothetical protein
MLIMEGYHPLGAPNSTELPDDYMAAVYETQRICQVFIGPFVALVVAFAVLAIVPAKSTDDSAAAE